jgi:hypothetical protein
MLQYPLLAGANGDIALQKRKAFLQELQLKLYEKDDGSSLSELEVLYVCTYMR